MEAKSSLVNEAAREGANAQMNSDTTGKYQAYNPSGFDRGLRGNGFGDGAAPLETS
jgi:hypothetical protein